jgi:eukaryotic-like serine/threonine-protein kinase
MPLAPGMKLGPYEILAPLGAGGMGEVYRARDTRLDRTVAIKILPPQFSSDPVRKQRFEREAKTISSLNHPHICVLYDVGHQDGMDYLVMECVEGETLARRLEKGSLPLDQVLKFGTQIADALDKAHRSGVVHRDLKPDNVMLTPTGAKLLDFGLAKAEQTAFAGDMSRMATLSKPLTAEGTIVGTFQYMAPEQLEGKTADARTDIFAFGAVLYEMATGKKAFEGKSHASLISAIMTAEPTPISQLQPMTPPALDRLVRTCMAKDPDERWQSAHDVAAELKWIQGTGSLTGSTAAVLIKTSRRERILWLGALALALAAFAATAARLFFQPASSSTPRARWIIGAPEKSVFHASGNAGGPVVVSPDGQRLAFVTMDTNGKQQLWVRPLDALKAEPLPGTEGAYYPFWSPDSRSLGFFSNGQLKRVSTDGGPVVPLCDVSLGRGGSWNKQGIIVFSPNVDGGLYQVSAAGGSPTPVTRVDFFQHDSHRWPYFLPDGQHFLFFAGGYDDLSSVHDGIYLATLDGKASKLLIHTHANAVFAAGHLLFLNDSTLMAQRLDVRRMELTGEPLIVEEGVEAEPGYWLGVFSASQNGVLAFAPINPNSGNRLTWFNSSGKQLGVVGDPGRYKELRLSPDGQQVAVEHSQPHRQLWIYDLNRNSKSQFTFGNSANASPVWSPDGKEIVFASDLNGHADLYAKSTSGSQAQKVLQESPKNKHPVDWSSDGKFLLYNESEHNKSSLWLLATQGKEAPRLLLQDPFYSEDGSFSPDGRWIAYSSPEQGAPQVFVMPFPGPGAKRQISSAGGAHASLWRKDGRAVIYSDDSGNLLETAVSVQNSELTVGATKVLFPGNPEAVMGVTNRTFDLARDGRFLINTRSQENQTQIVVVSNWDAGLKK